MLPKFHITAKFSNITKLRQLDFLFVSKHLYGTNNSMTKEKVNIKLHDFTSPHTVNKT